MKLRQMSPIQMSPIQMNPSIKSNSVLRNCLISAAIVLSVSAQAQNRPVRLSINNSSTVAFQSDVTGANDNGRSIAYFAGNVAGQANRRVMQLRVADPVLCADFNTNQSDSVVRLRLVDANQMFVDGGDGRGFRGLSPFFNETGGIRFIIDPADSNKRILNVSTELNLKCVVFPGGALPEVQPSASSKDAPEAFGDFSDGFEAVGTDLKTTISLPAQTLVNGVTEYTIRVDNFGPGTARNVQVRDFFINPISGQLNGTWTCAREGGATCSEPSGDSYIYQSGATLPSGSALVFTVRRVLRNTEGTFRVQAAAFSQPSENETNNADNAVASNPIQAVTNIAPTIGGLLTRIIDEDTNTGDLAFTVADPDNTGPLNVTAVVRGDSVQTPNPLINNSGISLATVNLNNRTIRLTPNANAFGFAIIDITVSDGITSITQGFSLQVNAVNDAPSFIFSPNCPADLGMQFTPENGSTPATMTFPVGTKGNYVCTAALLVNFGPFENAQNILAIADLEVVEAANILLGTGANAVNLQLGGATASLGFGLLGNSGSADIKFRIRDNGGSANGGIDLSPLKTLRIRVPSARPTMSIIAPQNSLEDVAVGPIGFTVNDTDTPLANLVLSSSSSNTLLIDSAGIVFGGSGNNRTLLLTPKLDQFGSATITVNLTDGDETATQSFLYTVTSVNDAPVFNVRTINLASNASLKQSVLVATGMGSGGGLDEQGQVLAWRPMLTHTPSGTGNILNSVLPIMSTNAAPTSTANMVFDLRDAGGGLPAPGFICLKARLFDNGAPSITTTKIVRIVVGTDLYPACDP